MKSESAEKKINAMFYKTETGNEPVKEFLLKLKRPGKTTIGKDIKFVEYSWKIDRPLVDQLKKGNGGNEKTIYEVRSTVLTKEYRTLFFVYKKLMILVHIFLKKTQKTPLADIDLAWSRMKKWIVREKGNYEKE